MSQLPWPPISSLSDNYSSYLPLTSLLHSHPSLISLSSIAPPVLFTWNNVKEKQKESEFSQHVWCYDLWCSMYLPFVHCILVYFYWINDALPCIGPQFSSAISMLSIFSISMLSVFPIIVYLFFYVLSSWMDAYSDKFKKGFQCWNGFFLIFLFFYIQLDTAMPPEDI